MIAAPEARADLEPDILRLLAGEVRPRVERIFDGPFGGETSADGSLTLRMFVVPAGFDFYLYRLVLDCNQATPLAPLSAGYAAVYQGPPSVAGIRLFLPRVAGGRLFPSLSVDKKDSAAVFHSESEAWFSVVGTTATMQVAGYYKGLLVEQ